MSRCAWLSSIAIAVPIWIGLAILVWLVLPR